MVAMGAATFMEMNTNGHYATGRAQGAAGPVSLHACQGSLFLSDARGVEVDAWQIVPFGPRFTAGFYGFSIPGNTLQNLCLSGPDPGRSPTAG
jgi:hypothetical protein